MNAAETIQQQDQDDPEYQAEHQQTKFANEIAIRVLAYRTEHGLTQTAFGRLVGLHQPHVARLEAGEHEPSLTTLARLSAALDVDFTVEIQGGTIRLRESA